MERTHFYSFSKPGTYRFKLFGNSIVLNHTLKNWNVIKTKSSSEGIVIYVEQTVKDQAHLIGLIQELNENHFTIISINKINKFFNLNKKI